MFQGLKIIRDYWKTAAIIGFSLALARWRFLNCDGPATPLNFTCLIGLETSVYIAGNQIVVDSTGANIAILVGLGHYYLRFISRVAASYFRQPPLQTYVSLTDRCQYMLLSLLPYSVFRSVHYAPSDDGYYAFNPLAPLIMLGMSMGTYKEKVHSKDPILHHPQH